MDFCLKGSAEREQMVFASAEIATNFRTLVERVHPDASESIALALIRMELLKDAGEQREIIRGSDHRTLARLYEQIAITACELANELGTPIVERHLAEKLADLTKQACNILGVPKGA